MISQEGGEEVDKYECIEEGKRGIDRCVCGMERKKQKRGGGGRGGGKEGEESELTNVCVNIGRMMEGWQTLTSSISQLCISSTVLCLATSLNTPPSPPPTTSTL